MNEYSEQQACEREAAEIAETRLIASLQEIPAQDDRYPGSFFRIPGAPIPGKTTWSLS